VSSGELALPGEYGLTADALLAGPSGRSLCVNLLDDRLTASSGRRRVPRVWVDALSAVRDGNAKRSARKLSECARVAGLSGTPFDGSALLEGLLAAVNMASYWQEPDDEDQGFAAEAAREALRPVAEAAAAAAAGIPDVRWWTEPVDRSRQRSTQFLDKQPSPEPLLTGAAEAVAAWLADTRDDERSAHDRPEDPAASYSGRWWSSPAFSRLPMTTRGLPALGALGLAVVENELSWQSARCWPVAPQDHARVYEISGPGQWAELVDRYPLDVSGSRRHDWWRATGWAGRWLIPDYAAVAADWDAVHVSVAGYLTTAGTAIPAGGGARTMLAGWDPDATWWLNDVLSLTSPPEDWRKTTRHPFDWTQAQ
jgi:hypothetical protein